MQAVIKATKAAIIAVTEAVNPVKNARPVHAMPRAGGPELRQLTLDWKATDK